MNTKRAASVFLCACLAVAFLAGCKAITPQHVTTLQGTIFNAYTGERIGGSDLDMYLMQGTRPRNPDLFYTGTTSNAIDKAEMGDYVFTDIPSMDLSPISTDMNPNEYRITVIKPGFQRFEGIIDDEMLAGKDNVIKNIYLFPDESIIPCYTFLAKFNGKAVPNVKVTLSPYATLNLEVFATDKWLSVGLNDVLYAAGAPQLATALSVLGLFNNHYFFPAPGYLASISKLTDTNGQANFCTTDPIKLTSGCVYAAIIQPTEYFEGVQLAPTIKALVADFSDAEQIIDLDTSEDYGNDYGLYVTSISNGVDDQIDATGTLSITFNRQVLLNQDTAIAPATSGFSANLTGASAAVWPIAPASRVNASLSADGLTLTLTPAWTTAPNLTTEKGQNLTYIDNNGSLSVKGYPASKILLSGLKDTDGDSISLTVHLSAP